MGDGVTTESEQRPVPPATRRTITARRVLVGSLVAVVATVVLGFVAVLGLIEREEALHQACSQATSRLIDAVDGPTGEYAGGGGWSVDSGWTPSCTYTYRGYTGQVVYRWGILADDRQPDLTEPPTGRPVQD